jgi:sulfur carrier protein ThiS
MPVTIIFRKQKFEIEPEMTVLKALKIIQLDPESVLVTRDGELITEDEIIHDGEVITFVAVISGGGLPG